MKMPRRNSISDRTIFQNVRQRGDSRPGRFFVLGTLADESLDGLHIGLITTKKIGNAVTRNRVRRYFRAIVQKHGADLSGPRYMVLIGRWTAKEANFAALEQDFLKVARKMGILHKTG